MARVFTAAAVASPAVLLWGCGGGDATTTAAPAAGEPGGDDYLVETFGHDGEFLWGSATAAAQIEGAWNQGGKQASIWDDFCHSKTTKDTNIPNFSKQCGKVPPGVPAEDESRWITLDVADDFYNLWEGDLDLLSKDYGMNAMRVSLSWPRIMPLNTTSGKHEMNPVGVQFYKDVFAGMKERGITPFVTLFHWDLPNDLSWLEDSVADEFVAYAHVAFEQFGEWVKDWATFNEPNSICSLGYGGGWFAPGHRDTTGPINCAHRVLQSHARTVKNFRDHKHEGQIGIVLDYKWAYPLTDSENDKKAAALDLDNVLGVWAEPIYVSGDYPQSLKDWYGSSMPEFTAEEKEMLKHSADFFGLNTYGGKFANWTDITLAEMNAGDDVVERYTFSPCANDKYDKSQLVDPKFECGAASSWLWAKPDAMRQYLNHVHKVFKADKVYVTEFGVDEAGESDRKTLAAATDDKYRQDYYQRYMKQIADAKKEDGVPLKGVFAWSLMDNFEWGDGLNFRFGITYVNFTDQSRHPKGSAKWWKQLIARMKPEGMLTV